MAMQGYIGGAGNAFCRKVFSIEKKLKSAVITMTADSHSYAYGAWMHTGAEHNWLLAGSWLKYRLFVNGSMAGAGPARPIVDSHVVEHRFDVSDLLRKGKNVLGVISRGEQYGFCLTLTLHYEDGSKHKIMSGNSWKILPANDIFAPFCWSKPMLSAAIKGSFGPGETGEHLNGELYPFGWLERDFDDSGWKKANVTASADVCEREVADIPNYHFIRVAPVAIRRLDSRRILVDFGRHIVGAPELRSRRGGMIEVRLGEELMPDGALRFQMRTGNCYQEGWLFPPRGGVLTNFGLRSFRYAEIVDYPGELSGNSIAAIAVNSPFADGDSRLDLADERLEKVWKLCRNSVEYTTMDVYYDCPSRERMAYEADAYINMLTHFNVEHRTRVARRTILYQMNHYTWPCEWRMFMIPVVYEYFMHTGDLSLVRDVYDRLKDECSFHRLLRDGLVPDFPMRVIVDWPVSCLDNYEFGRNSAVPNAFVFWSLNCLSKLAGYLGKSHESDSFAVMAAEVKEAFHRRLLNSENGLFQDHPETAHNGFHTNMFALAFNLVDPARISPVIDFIDRAGMKCSVYGAQFYLDALFMHGKAQRAIELMSSDSDRSWLRMIAEGATTATEAWSTELKPNMSFVHPWGSAPANVIPRWLFGLRPTAPGWKEYCFEPNPGNLQSGHFELRLPEGLLKARFERLADGSLFKECSLKRD